MYSLKEEIKTLKETTQNRTSAEESKDTVPQAAQPSTGSAATASNSSYPSSAANMTMPEERKGPIPQSAS